MLDLSPRVAKQRDDLDFNPALLLSSQWLIELDVHPGEALDNDPHNTPESVDRGSHQQSPSSLSAP